MPEGYRLLDAGYYRLLDGAGPYAWDGTTFALMGSGKGAGGVAPILAAPTAVDFSDIFVWGQVTTDTASGTLYAVVVPFAETTPTAAQIIAGTNAAGAAAPNGNLAITTTGVKDVLVRGLTAVTFYKVCFAHQAAGGDSNVVTGNFTTDTLVVALATSGAATGITPGTGSAAIGINQADPHGGTNAVRWVDNNDAGTGTVPITLTVGTYFAGVNKFHITVKHVSGAAHMRMAPLSTTIVAAAFWNTSTGTIGTESWIGTPVTFDVATGWKMFSGSLDMTGADVIGNLQYNKGLADNVTNTVVRNGTNIQDLYNIRITRV